jgi:putative CocE/NonD family hydrolase
VAEPVRLKILYNGSQVGQNVYDSKPDGGFDSITDFKIGTIDLGSTVSGHLAAGKLKDFAYLGTSGGSKVSITYKDGKIAAEVRGKSNSVPFKDEPGLLFGSLHPQFCVSSLLFAEKSIRDKPSSPEVEIRGFLVDGGQYLKFKVRSLPVRSVKVGAKLLTARRFEVNLGSVQAEYALDDANEVVGMDVPAQKIRFVGEGWEGLYVDPLATYPELSQPAFKVKNEVGVKMKTRDGVELVCDVMRPDDDQPHPTILQRTPYGRNTATPDGPFWASRGYCYVCQDCRGREDSGGEWDPFVHEGPDGYDTIQWIASQPWSDGKVGMIGGSYGGYVQWAAATQNPPALKCIVPQVSPPDAMRNLPYEFGAFYLYADLWWAKIVAGKKTDLSGIHATLAHPEKLTTLPLGKVDEAVLGERLEFFQKWLRRETSPDWKGFDYTEYLANSHVPALHISGNWDGDGIGTALNWDAMQHLGRKDQWIIFGPWIHAFNTTHSLGDVEYGQDAILELDSVYLRWFDTWLKVKSVGLDKVPHVKLFVTGANKWIETSAWPTASMPERTLYLGKDGLTEKPGIPSRHEYIYDPSKDTEIPGEFKNSSLENSSSKGTRIPAKMLQDKKLVFLSGAPLLKTTAITGPFQVRLHFKSSAVNTDFFGSIVDVSPDGSARALGMAGKLRAAYLGGMDKVRPLTPNKEYVATLTPWQFAHEFARGHRIGLMIMSSTFPMFARNLGTVDPIATATRMVVQRNTILTGKGHESSVSFHVLWEK